MLRGIQFCQLTVVFALVASLSIVGCKKDVVDTFNKIQESEPEPEPPPVSKGAIKLTLDQPVETDGCYVSFYTFATGRPSVLRIASYPDPAQEAFPSVMLQAQVDVDSASALAGASVQAEVYVMTAEGGATWHSNPETVEIKITSINGNKVVGQIVGGTLKNPETDSTTSVTGTFDGSML